METQISMVGWALMILSLVHAGFPRYFKWKEELPRLGLFNRQVFGVHTFFIALLLFLMGLMCVVDADALVSTSFGRHVSLGLSFFWLVRLYFQFFVYSPKLWKGKRFETVVHIVFSLFWTYMGLLFFLAAFPRFNTHIRP